MNVHQTTITSKITQKFSLILFERPGLLNKLQIDKSKQTTLSFGSISLTKQKTIYITIVLTIKKKRL